MYKILTYVIKYSIIVLESNWKIAMFGVKAPVIAMLGGWLEIVSHQFVL